MHRRRISRWIVVIYICCLISGTIGCQKKEIVQLEEISKEDIEEPTQEEQAETKEFIYVYVCGAVMIPGVYELPGISRIYEAIEAAGGMREDAAISYLNQAELLVDGGRVEVPTIEEQEAQKEATVESRQEVDSRINLNTASKEELMTLTGIGEAKATSIISYREANGNFKTIEELMQIEGIKNGVFQKIKDYIVV